MPEELLRVFQEAFLSSTLWQFSSEIYYFALLAFNGPHLIEATVVATAGGFLAAMLNTLLGRMAAQLQESGTSAISQEKYAAWQDKLNFFVWAFGLASFINLFAILLFLCGFFRVQWWRVITSVLIGQAGYYAYSYLDAMKMAAAAG